MDKNWHCFKQHYGVFIIDYFLSPSFELSLGFLLDDRCLGDDWNGFY